MKVGFIISVYNKIDDLVAHLEMFKYYPFKHEVIVVYMHDLPPSYKEEVDKYHAFQINGYGHYIGPLLSAVAGVKKAAELGLDYVVYRNADDWLFNYDWEWDNFNKLKDNDYWCAGYNWLNVGVDYDITLNQVYFKVSEFIKTADDAEAYFKRSPKGYLCEYKLPRWVKRTCTDMGKQFYRLPGREQEPGIGWERKDLYNAFVGKGVHVPVGFWERLEENNRFFNRKWQLIGSHDVGARLNYWRKIRSEVAYGRQIEKDKHFARFMEAARTGKPWNLPEKPETRGEPSHEGKKPKIFSHKIF